MKRKNKIVLVCVVVLACIVVILIVLPESISRQKIVSLDPRVLYRVESVIDGDTFTLSIQKKSITVRMLGIDTPETVDPRKDVQCYGVEASQEARKLLEGRSVRLVMSPQREVLDKYGRYLAYVYRDDEIFINEHLLETGFAREYTYGKAYSLQREFRRLEQEAKQQKKGLWRKCKEIIG
jgi:micrococcal nuclease